MTDKIMTLFLDASVIGGYYDKEFEVDMRRLFQDIKKGRYKAVLSTLVMEELEGAPQKVKDILNDLEYSLIEITPECRALADEYISEKVVGATNRNDCTHISTATIFNIDILVSWNFQHIVNVQRIRGYNSVNIKRGYKVLEIRNPKEVVFYE